MVLLLQPAKAQSPNQTAPQRPQAFLLDHQHLLLLLLLRHGMDRSLLAFTLPVPHCH